MGIPYLWSFLRKKGYETDLLSQFPQDPPPSGGIYRVDILASFFPIIRCAYANHDLLKANTIVARHLAASGISRASAVFYIDGPSPKEKQKTREFRDEKRRAALAKATTLISDMEDIFQRGGKLQITYFRKLAKHINASFMLSMDSRRALAHFLREHGWTVIECEPEADIAIARDCRDIDIVVSADSDILNYKSIKTIWRPMGRSGFRIYNVSKLLKCLEISRTAFTTLVVVCRNDYSLNVRRLGVSSNYKIILSLDKEEFTAADSATFLQDIGVCDIIQKLKSLRLGLENIKKYDAIRSSINVKKHERPQAFNRYNTIDKPSEHRPDPHSSGRKYKYRERYAIKTRTQLKKHEPPEMLKKYRQKPWKSIPESPLDRPNKTSSSKPKKQSRDLATMDKKALVKAMQWDHPIRTLDIGTVNANATLLGKGGVNEAIDATEDASDDTKSTNSTNTTNTTCTINTTNITSAKILSDVDRKLLSILCPAFTVKELTGSNEESDQEPYDPEGVEEHDDTLDKKDVTLSFLMSLLTALHSTKLPKKSGTGLYVRSFIEQAQEFLPFFSEGYIPSGSIRTDGFRLQLLVFKLNELHSVKYKRLPTERLPPRLTNTVGGTEYYLTEIRNVISSKHDISQYWDFDPSEIKILGIDLGQAFVVGASAIIPPHRQTHIKQGRRSNGTSQNPVVQSTKEMEEDKHTEMSPLKFLNLSVKKKAVYQPILKHRRWLERRMEQEIEGACLHGGVRKQILAVI
ncbi:hypothetical protein FBU30_004238 [Linnemannia zychae]|nr:hypothetical protein FBU30_004238 [Linnemannia zychae]